MDKIWLHNYPKNIPENIDKNSHSSIVDLINDDFKCSNFHEEQFDVIVITSALPMIEEDLKKLLKLGGKLFIVVGSKNHMHASLVTRTTKMNWHTKSLFETHLEYLKGHEPVEQFSF